MALQTADLSFTITDAVRNQPVRGLSPGAWIDKVGDRPDGKAAGPSCKDRVGLYFSGRVGLRPLIDANGYLILTMNRDSTISVIDPKVVVGGTSNVLYDQVILSPARRGLGAQPGSQETVRHHAARRRGGRRRCRRSSP